MSDDPEDVPAPPPAEPTEAEALEAMRPHVRGPYVPIGADMIDCEVEHPQLGWIPYTAGRADTGDGALIWRIAEEAVA